MSFLDNIFGTANPAQQQTQYVGGSADYANQQQGLLQQQGTSALARRTPSAVSTYANTSGQATGVGAAQGAAMGTAAQAGLYTGQAAGSAGQVTGVGNTLQALGEQGAGSGLTGQAGLGLLGIGNAAPGQSAADLALQQQGGQSLLAQAALAAGARGGDAGLANQNAAANAGQIAGTTQQNLGVQMAQEYATNQALKAQALGQAGNIFAGQTAQQAENIGQAGQQFATAGGLLGQSAGLANQSGTLQLGAGQLGLGQENTTTSQDQAAAALALQQLSTQENYQQNAQQMGYGLQTADAQLAQQAANNNLQSAIGTNKSNASAQGSLLSTAAEAAPLLMMLSDKRAKKNVKPAAKEIGDLFRGAGAHSYEYRDPSAQGAKGGKHFGPMAQELEKTPAGRSAVISDPAGMKHVDTQALSLLMSSEVGRQRKEIDELRAAVFGKKVV